ncbi:hypothetical protein SUGI_0238770 [Cryptomeria japonica]|nr:hypothetical protein SUGI_0238770 [Cryptomeria japonica]
MEEMDCKFASDVEESIIAIEMESAQKIETLRRVCVEEACNQFREYLKKMLVEEKDTRILKDVEELLRCQQLVRLPVYREMIASFYLEVCVDIFSDFFPPFEILHEEDTATTSLSN